MSQAIRNLEPKALWNFFADINAVPRASKKEERIVAHMVAFGEKLGLETKVDGAQNVAHQKSSLLREWNTEKLLFYKRTWIWLHQKNNSSNFDFDTQGIVMQISNGWGACQRKLLWEPINGIGVAAIMSVLASNNIAHPSIEALFTIDEENRNDGSHGDSNQTI